MPCQIATSYNYVCVYIGIDIFRLWFTVRSSWGLIWKMFGLMN